MKTTHRCVCGIMLAAWAFGLGGCGKPNITVTLDAMDSRDAMPTVEVHLIGVSTAGESSRLHDAAISNYDWAAGRRDEKVFVMKFGEGLENPQTLTPKDPIWGKWNGPKQLVVIASFPPSDDMGGNADPRRLILPLKWNSWSGGEIPIVIRSSGLVCEQAYTPSNPFEE